MSCSLVPSFRHVQVVRVVQVCVFFFTSFSRAVRLRCDNRCDIANGTRHKARERKKEEEIEKIDTIRTSVEVLAPSIRKAGTKAVRHCGRTRPETGRAGEFVTEG